MSRAPPSRQPCYPERAASSARGDIRTIPGLRVLSRPRHLEVVKRPRATRPVKFRSISGTPSAARQPPLGTTSREDASAVMSQERPTGPRLQVGHPRMETSIPPVSGRVVGRKESPRRRRNTRVGRALPLRRPAYTCPYARTSAALRIALTKGRRFGALLAHQSAKISQERPPFCACPIGVLGVDLCEGVGPFLLSIKRPPKTQNLLGLLSNGASPDTQRKQPKCRP